MLTIPNSNPLCHQLAGPELPEFPERLVDAPHLPLLLEVQMPSIPQLILLRVHEHVPLHVPGLGTYTGLSPRHKLMVRIDFVIIFRCR